MTVTIQPLDLPQVQQTANEIAEWIGSLLLAERWLKSDHKTVQANGHARFNSIWAELRGPIRRLAVLLNDGDTALLNCSPEARDWADRLWEVACCFPPDPPEVVYDRGRPSIRRLPLDKITGIGISIHNLPEIVRYFSEQLSRAPSAETASTVNTKQRRRGTTPRKARPDDQQSRETAAHADPRHSRDFRSVVWFATPYSFTKNQAKCVKLLWEAWEAGTPDRDASILEDADVAQCRVVDVFRGNPALGTMIVTGQTKGTYRLAPRPTPAAEPSKSRKTPRKTPPKKNRAS